MGRRFRPRRGTVRPNIPFGACGLSVGEEQPSFPRAGGCGPGPHSLVWGVRVGRPRLLGRTALGRALASGRKSGLPTIHLAKAGYYWFEPFRAARAWRRRGLGVSRHGLSLFRGAARYTLIEKQQPKLCVKDQGHIGRLACIEYLVRGRAIVSERLPPPPVYFPMMILCATLATPRLH